MEDGMMFKLITKQFLQYWKIWLSVLPVFLASGLVFSTSFTILKGMSEINNTNIDDYSVFMQMPIVTGAVILLLLTTNTIKQCIDFFDDTNDILLLLGAAPLQLSFLMTGQMILIGAIGTIVGSFFALPAAKAFFSFLPSASARQAFSHLPIHLSGKVIFITLLLQISIITITCMRYCLKNFKKRKGTLSSFNALIKMRFNGIFFGILSLIISIGGTFYLYLKNLPDSSVMKEYTQSMNNSMNVLLLLWLSLLVVMNFLVRPIFRAIVDKVVDLPTITNYPMLRTALSNMQYNVEGIIKLIRPVSIITLLIGNFIALFLNTKLLIDGANSGSYISDLILSLEFLFGAPIIISLANIFASICLFRIRTKGESKSYYYTGCTPNWIFKTRIIEFTIVSLISIGITLIGTALFAIPLLRVTYLGGGNIFKANWSVNILLSFGTFLMFTLCFISMYWIECLLFKKYVE
jgi:hypothetical protein